MCMCSLQGISPISWRKNLPVKICCLSDASLSIKEQSWCVLWDLQITSKSRLYSPQSFSRRIFNQAPQVSHVEFQTLEYSLQVVPLLQALSPMLQQHLYPPMWMIHDAPWVSNLVSIICKHKQLCCFSCLPHSSRDQRSIESPEHLPVT